MRDNSAVPPRTSFHFSQRRCAGLSLDAPPGQVCLVRPWSEIPVLTHPAGLLFWLLKFPALAADETRRQRGQVKSSNLLDNPKLFRRVVEDRRGNRLSGERCPMTMILSQNTGMPTPLIMIIKKKGGHGGHHGGAWKTRSKKKAGLGGQPGKLLRDAKSLRHIA